MKLSTTIFTTFMVTVFTAGIAGAWGLPSPPSIPSAPGAPAPPSVPVVKTSAAADPDVFLAKAKKSENLIDNSADSLFKAVASKEEQAKIEEMKKKMNETSDDKEKGALRQQITESEMATIQKQTADKKMQEDAKKWDEKKKKLVANSFYNFSLGSLQASALVPEGQSIAGAIQSNPANAARMAPKLKAVADSVKTLGGIATSTAKVVSGLKPMMSAAKIEVKTPTSIADQPKQIEGGI
jgi:glucan-binding YG repeat protein